MIDPDELEALAATKHVRLTTFRRDGTPVPTPVWLVRDGAHLLVITDASTGKAKRIRHTARVLLAPSDSRGRVAPGVVDIEGIAEIVTDPEEAERLRGLLKGRYGFEYAVGTLMQRLRGLSFDRGVELRISLQP